MTLPNQNPKRVLFIAPTPPPWAGPEIVSQTLLDNDVLQRSFEICHLRTTLHSSNRDKGKITLGGMLKLFRMWLTAAKKILFWRPTLIYTTLSQNGTGWFRDASFIWLAHVTCRPIVLHFHGGDFQCFYRRQNILMQRFVRATLTRVAGVIVLANRLQEQFDGIVDPSRVHVLYNGVALPGQTEARSSSCPGIHVLYIGSLSVSKGVDTLLETAYRLAKRDSKIRFTLAGEPIPNERNITHRPDGTALRTYDFTASSQHPSIRITPPVSGSEKTALYLESDVLVLDSYSEGLPMAVLEAMSQGLAMVVSPVGALPEILQEGENALFVRPGSTTDLEAALVRLAHDPVMRQKMGENNRTLIVEKFSAEKLAAGLAAIFQQTLAMV